MLVRLQAMTSTSRCAIGFFGLLRHSNEVEHLRKALLVPNAGCTVRVHTYNTDELGARPGEQRLLRLSPQSDWRAARRLVQSSEHLLSDGVHVVDALMVHGLRLTTSGRAICESQNLLSRVLLVSENTRMIPGPLRKTN